VGLGNLAESRKGNGGDSGGLHVDFDEDRSWIVLEGR